MFQRRQRSHFHIAVSKKNAQKTIFWRKNSCFWKYVARFDCKYFMSSFQTCWATLYYTKLHTRTYFCLTVCGENCFRNSQFFSFLWISIPISLRTNHFLNYLTYFHILWPHCTPKLELNNELWVSWESSFHPFVSEQWTWAWW